MLVYCRYCCLILIVSVFLSVGCSNQNSEKDARFLFSLDYGDLPGQVFPWNIGGVSTSHTAFFARNRQIYISNNDSLMIFSSSGILLTHVSDEKEERFRRSLAERGITHIPIDESEHILLREIADDGMVFFEQRVSQQSENGQGQLVSQFYRLDTKEQILKRFPNTINDKNFNLIPHFILGRQSVFLYESERDNLKIYTFSLQGEQIQEIATKPRNFVPTSGKFSNSITQVMSMVPHKKRPELYFQVNYYNQASRSQLNTDDTAGITRSLLFQLDQRTGVVTQYMDLTDLFESKFKLEYIDENDSMVFSDYSNTEGRYRILVTNSAKEIQYVYFLNPPYEMQVESYFTFDPAGHVSVLYMLPQKAEIFRWNI